MIAAGVIMAIALMALTAQHVWWHRRTDELDAVWQGKCDEVTGRLADDLNALQDANTSLIVEAASNHVLMHRATDRINDLEIFLAVATERAEGAETALRGELQRQQKRASSDGRRGASAGLRTVKA